MEVVSTVNHSRHPVPDESYVGDIRRLVKGFCLECGLPEEKVEKAAIVASEMATNLAKHAQKGEILLSQINLSDTKGVELLSVDHGPGIEDLESAQIDGVTSSDTLGGGLGSIKRLADTFEITSCEENGTVLRAFISESQTKFSATYGGIVDIGAISVPHPRETVSGDGIGYAIGKDSFSLLVVDGLGHGREAAHARELAVQSFLESPFDCSKEIVERMHDALHNTRGAAVAMSRVDLEKNTIDFCGVGNITAKVLSTVSTKSFYSSFGVVGGKLNKLKSENYEYGNGYKLLFFSDGIGSKAQIGDYKELSASMIACSLFRDYGRLTDDATVCVVKDLRY